MSLQHAKQIIRKHYAAIEQSTPNNITNSLTQNTHKDWRWRGFHPCNEQIGAPQVANIFWQPLLTSLNRLQRREDIFFAGHNEIDNGQSTWVVSMGHLTGLFDHDFLAIPATQKMAFLRYAEFNKVVGNKITETALYFDLPHLMVQAGLNPFPSQRAAQLVQPGPITHDGLLYDNAPSAEGEKTLATINAMITDLGQWQNTLPLEQELAQTWHDDMIWWGPTGIGASYTIERYAKQHSAPFRAALSERSPTNHICRLAEGHYGGFFGWPNFTAINSGNFLGIPSNQQASEFRVIDIYRRTDNKLAENWVFIDLPHWAAQQGVKILP